MAAICAASSILGSNGMLAGKQTICYPGFEEQLTGAEIVNKNVVHDGQFITSKGLGTAIDFSLTLIAILADTGAAVNIARGVQYR